MMKVLRFVSQAAHGTLGAISPHHSNTECGLTRALEDFVGFFRLVNPQREGCLGFLGHNRRCVDTELDDKDFSAVIPHGDIPKVDVAFGGICLRNGDDKDGHLQPATILDGLNLPKVS